ncbi:hypothetical protein [Bradyrhizobium zhanjiangense]|uniref:hypothetical protein n=1 Tax=Bradyrhizobium zhanjiangense TaxID=1325107 RepID=UPI001FE06472|nr:hypothetical protein [Bradyrhizobium zhanjiangense]
MTLSRKTIGQPDQPMGRDPFHTAAHRPVERHLAENQKAEPRAEQSDKGPIVHPAQEASAASSAHFGSVRGVSASVTAYTDWMKRGRQIWHEHLQRGQLPEGPTGSMGNIERWLLGLLSVVVLVGCVCATIVFTQVKSLKVEIATLQREIIALKLRVARLDQIATANEAREKPSSEPPKPPPETRPDQASLILSREEIQLIRDYIKPAPVAGSVTESIKVGDPVSGETIPFPSPITEKVRKLLGARFTIRSGVIVITRNGSHYADAVIGSN